MRLHKFRKMTNTPLRQQHCSLFLHNSTRKVTCDVAGGADVHSRYRLQGHRETDRQTTHVTSAVPSCAVHRARPGQCKNTLISARAMREAALSGVGRVAARDGGDKERTTPLHSARYGLWLFSSTPTHCTSFSGYAKTSTHVDFTVWGDSVSTVLSSLTLKRSWIVPTSQTKVLPPSSGRVNAVHASTSTWRRRQHGATNPNKTICCSYCRPVIRTAPESQSDAPLSNNLQHFFMFS